MTVLLPKTKARIPRSIDIKIAFPGQPSKTLEGITKIDIDQKFDTDEWRELDADNAVVNNIQTKEYISITLEGIVFYPTEQNKNNGDLRDRIGYNPESGMMMDELILTFDLQIIEYRPTDNKTRETTFTNCRITDRPINYDIMSNDPIKQTIHIIAVRRRITGWHGG